MAELAALSLACSIFQVISFSHECFLLLREVSRSGQPNAAAAERAENLSKLSTKLQKSLSCEEKWLHELSDSCLRISKDLRHELDKVCSGGSKLRIFAKALIKKSKIERLAKEMERNESQLKSALVVDARLRSKASELLHNDRLNQLDEHMQRFLQYYSDLLSQVKKEAEDTRQHVTITVKELEAANVSRDMIDKFLGSLRYDKMNERKSQITQPHPETFQWLFKSQIKRPWDSFSQWLQTGEKVYWINGKAGSGKSTLMKFLIQDPRTLEGLKAWTATPNIIAHFIWNVGDTMQKSTRGLLLTLCHQLLQNNRDECSSLLREQPELAGKLSPNDWSLEELEKFLILVLAGYSGKVCIFIDGLDEIDQEEGAASLLSLLQRLQKQENLKFCLSSRPEREFQIEFGTSARQLRLQDLNERDIRKYARSFLKQDDRFLQIAPQGQSSLTWLIDTLTLKAQGVFLWVHLALKDLQRGVTREDDWSTLTSRLETLPSDLFHMYQSMWQRLGNDELVYRKEAAFYFNLTLEILKINEWTKPCCPPRIFYYAYAIDAINGKDILDQQVGLSEVYQKCGRACRRVEDCSAGMLEVVFSTTPPAHPRTRNVTATDNESDESSNEDWDAGSDEDGDGRSDEGPGHRQQPGDQGRGQQERQSLLATITFAHRSAADFLKSTEAGQKLLSFDSSDQLERNAALMHARFLALRLDLSFSESFIEIFHMINAMYQLWVQHERNETYLRSGDNFMTNALAECEGELDALISKIRRIPRPPVSPPNYLPIERPVTSDPRLGWLQDFIEGIMVLICGFNDDTAVHPHFERLFVRYIDKLSSRSGHTQAFLDYLLFQICDFCGYNFRWPTLSRCIDIPLSYGANPHRKLQWTGQYPSGYGMSWIRQALSPFEVCLLHLHRFLAWEQDAVRYELDLGLKAVDRLFQDGQIARQELLVDLYCHIYPPKSLQDVPVAERADASSDPVRVTVKCHPLRLLEAVMAQSIKIVDSKQDFSKVLEYLGSESLPGAPTPLLFVSQDRGSRFTPNTPEVQTKILPAIASLSDSTLPRRQGSHPYTSVAWWIRECERINMSQSEAETLLNGLPTNSWGPSHFWRRGDSDLEAAYVWLAEQGYPDLKANGLECPIPTNDWSPLEDAEKSSSS